MYIILQESGEGFEGLDSLLSAGGTSTQFPGFSLVRSAW